MKLSWIVEPLLKWYDTSARILPWRQNPTPYRVWISEIMLQQTRVEAVLPFFERFLAALPDLSSLADAEEEELLKLWEGLGYYTRVRNLQKAARIIRDEYGGEFPQDYPAIRKLPGIGDYTAGAIASIAFGQPEPAVDGNVLRVHARLCERKQEIRSTAWKKTADGRAAEDLSENPVRRFHAGADGTRSGRLSAERRTEMRDLSAAREMRSLPRRNSPGNPPPHRKERAESRRENDSSAPP